MNNDKIYSVWTDTNMGDLRMVQRLTLEQAEKFAKETAKSVVDAIGMDCEIKTVTLAGGTGTALIETWTRATEAVAAAQADVVAGQTLRLCFIFSMQ